MAPTTKAEQSFLQQPSSRSSFSAAEPRRLLYEAPQVPYAVYYATLVLWCGAMAKENAAAAQAAIARGERILSLHKVHIAQLLARVLNELGKAMRNYSQTISIEHNSQMNRIHGVCLPAAISCTRKPDLFLSGLNAPL